MRRLADFDQLLRDGGIPIDGVSGAGPACRIDFRNEATEAQRSAARQMAQNFDWRERRPKDLQALVGEIQGLPSSQLQTLLAAVAAQVVRGDPQFARRIGVPLDGEEI